MFLTFLAMSWLMSCTGTPIRDFCLIAEPHYFEKSEHQTVEELRREVIHNRAGAELCGW